MQPKGVRYGGRKKGTPNKATADVKALAQVHGPEAIRTLVSLFQNKKSPAAARVAAIKELLDRGYGKAPQAVELTTPTPLAGVVEVVVRTREEAKDVLSRLRKADGVS